jgi:F-type H+-transporting ATPase subunit a
VVPPVLADLLPNVNALFDWKGIFSNDTILAFNKTALMAFVSTLLCVGIFVVGSRKKALVPAGVQNAAEVGYEFVEDQIGVQVMGAEAGKHWAPFLGCLFFWIFFINIWSVVPFIYFPATARIAIPLFLAIMVWFIFIIVGFKSQGTRYIPNSLIPRGVPKPMLLLVVPIEFFSKFLLRPFSLAVRLFANMAAGHVLLAVFAIMTNELLIVHNSGLFQIAFSPLPFIGLVAMTGLELLVALLQAYIFTILTAVYVAESLHPEH